MYDLLIKPEVDKLFQKLSKKDPKRLIIISKKIAEIRANPHHDYKFLRKPLQNLNRIHIDKHFVLIFRIEHGTQTVEILDFGHHDDVYK